MKSRKNDCFSEENSLIMPLFSRCGDGTRISKIFSKNAITFLFFEISSWNLEHKQISISYIYLFVYSCNKLYICWEIKLLIVSFYDIFFINFYENYSCWTAQNYLPKISTSENISLLYKWIINSVTNFKRKAMKTITSSCDRLI